MMKKNLFFLFLTLLLPLIGNAQNEVTLKVREIFFECSEIKEKDRTYYVPYEISIYMDIINYDEAIPLLFGSNYSHFEGNGKHYGLFKMILDNDTIDFYTRWGDMLYLIDPSDTLDFIIDNDNQDYWKIFRISKEDGIYSNLGFSLNYYPVIEDYPNIFETYFIKTNTPVDVTSFIVHYCYGEKRVSFQHSY